MGLFEGKTPTERNKIIAAGVLGLVSLIALYLAFGRGSTTTATTKSTPKPAASPGAVKTTTSLLPTPSEQQFLYETTPVVYRPGMSGGAPDPGRNIFAFYEPPPPTPFVPPPPPTPTPPKPASPTPTPVFLASSLTPQSVYAGSRSFRMDVNGDRFTPDARIYFNQTEMPTVFVNAQQIMANIPDNLVSTAGPRQVIVQTPDGRSYSFPLIMTVQAPPKPTNLQYIGMIGRKRYNNDTAYFIEAGKPLPCPGCPPTPFGARLNDVVGGRFRLIDISTAEVVVEDVNLGFKHRVPITPASGVPNGSPFGSQGQIPGIPNNIQRYAQPQQRPTPQKPGDKKEDVDDNDDPGGQ